MSSLLDVLSTRNTSEEVAKALQDYRNFLASAKDRLPASTYEFAAAPWHYDYQDHRCPHDSWVEWLTIREPSSGKRREIRSIEIAARFFGAYHDGHLELSYSDVQSHSITGKNHARNLGHGDWLAD